MDSAMAIRRQLLRNLKQHSAGKNDQAHKNKMSRISQTKERADDYKRSEAFKIRRGGQSRSGFDRRDRRIGDGGEQRPCGNGYEFVNHANFISDRMAPR